MKSQENTMGPLLFTVVWAIAPFLTGGCTETVGPTSNPMRTTGIETVNPADLHHPAGAPSEFEQPTNLMSYTVRAFFPDPLAAAYAQMEYFGSHAEQSVSMEVREVGGMATHSAQNVSQSAELFPWVRTLSTDVHIWTDQSCGQRADATAFHKTWHEVIVIGQWGMKTGNSMGHAVQPQCGGGGGGGGGGGTGGDECYICQQWFWVVDGIIVDEWWECWEVDSSICDGFFT